MSVGIKREREKFRGALNKCSRLHAAEKDVRFEPVGWEDTTGGVGRPQELINEDLRQCDYALFVFHDRWGSPTGSGHSSGTAEEWALAEELYAANKIRNIALLFKKVNDKQLKDPGNQLKEVISFKNKIEKEKRYLFSNYASLKEFEDYVDSYLSKWLTAHNYTEGRISEETTVSLEKYVDENTKELPSFEYWYDEAKRNFDLGASYSDALFCASKAQKAAQNEFDRAKAKNIWAVAQINLGKVEDAIAAFSEIISEIEPIQTSESRVLYAKVLYNRAVTLGLMGRNEEALIIYDDIINRFKTTSETALKEEVAWALFNKGGLLAEASRSDDAIATFDEVIIRFGTAHEISLRTKVAECLYNKGYCLRSLNRNDDAIAVYDEIVSRFGASFETALCGQVAQALVSKGIALGILNRTKEEIDVYNEVLARFDMAETTVIREQVASAMLNKAMTLGTLNRKKEAVAIYDDVIARFENAQEPAIMGLVEEARKAKKRGAQRNS